MHGEVVVARRTSKGPRTIRSGGGSPCAILVIVELVPYSSAPTCTQEWPPAELPGSSIPITGSTACERQVDRACLKARLALGAVC